MEKIKNILFIFLMFFIVMLGNNVYATSEMESKKLLYQDVTVNSNGSLTVKEALWLNGDYTGTDREIKFKKYDAYQFSGIYSNFSGDSDIYDATKISNIKVFDISQSNFNSFDDINNVEREFKKIEKTTKGNYGFYTIAEDSDKVDIRIYCPAQKEKVFYLEYTIENAIVVHNDVAELYWCFLENLSSEIILDYKLVVHLPKEDNNVMVWSHGPATGYCSIVNYKTLTLEDLNIAPNKYETLRIMFNKDLVPDAQKKSNVNGKEHIIRYENAMANPDIAEIETEKIYVENELSEIFLGLDKEPHIFWYNYAIEYLEKLTWDDKLKNQYQEKLDNLKEIVNQEWINNLEWEYNNIIKNNNISQNSIDYLVKVIDEGFDEHTKEEYYAKANELQEILNKKQLETKQTILQIVFVSYCVLGVICILKLAKIFLERKCYNEKYYRDFPSDDKAYIVDYLVNKKITTKTFLVTILDLIATKKIILERNPNIEDDFIFVLSKKQFDKTSVEDKVIEILFNIIGNNNKCSMNKLKNYSTDVLGTDILSHYPLTRSNALRKSTHLIKQFQEFEKNVEKEIERKEYFKKNDNFNKILKIAIIIICSISIILGFFINGNGYISLLNYYCLIIILAFVYNKIVFLDKNRTKKGKLEYSKWLSHKRFLKDFGRFEAKDLPEIILWDRYFVTAVILGCADQVVEKMKISIVDYESMEELQSMLHQYFLYRDIKQLERTFNSLINTAKSQHSTIGQSSSRSSSYSSGGGYGGGSSSGGSGGGGGGWSRF